MLNPCYFTDGTKQVGCHITLDSHHINLSNSKLPVNLFHKDNGIETRFIIKVLKEMATIYVRIINQYRLKNHTVFSTKFGKQNEDIKVLDEIEVYMNLKTFHNLTEFDTANIDIISPLAIKFKNKNWRIVDGGVIKLIQRKYTFCNTAQKNGSRYVKIPFRSTAILNFENDDKYRFLWSILYRLHPGEKSHPIKVSDYRQ